MVRLLVGALVRATRVAPAHSILSAHFDYE